MADPVTLTFSIISTVSFVMFVVGCRFLIHFWCKSLQSERNNSKLIPRDYPPNSKSQFVFTGQTTPRANNANSTVTFRDESAYMTAAERSLQRVYSVPMEYDDIHHNSLPISSLHFVNEDKPPSYLEATKTFHQSLPPQLNRDS